MGTRYQASSPRHASRAWLRVIRDHGLSLVLAVIFLGAVVGQAIVGWKDANAENHMHDRPAVSMGKYLESGDFGEALFENWESEFLQLAVYVVLTAFLFQRGSAESKDPDARGGKRNSERHLRKWPAWQSALYRHSLSLTFFAIFLLSFTGHAICGAAAYNEEAVEHGRAAISAWSYLGSSRFWFESLQNWQSEFLAILAIVVLSIWLREDGSPESKSIGSSNAETGK